MINNRYTTMLKRPYLYVARLLATTVLILLMAFPVYAERYRLELVGYARDVDSGELYYTENHIKHHDDKAITKHEVRYANAQGEVFATKTLDYSRGLYAPAFRLEDKRTGYIEGARYTEQGYQLFNQKPGDDMKYEVVGDGKYPLMADAGFDTFMRDNLSALSAGEVPVMELAVAGRLSSYNFRAKAVAEHMIFGQPAVEVHSEPASRLLRLLTGPLTLFYQKDNGQLLRYEGMTNIRNIETGKLYTARIEFPVDEIRKSPLDDMPGDAPAKGEMKR